MRIRDFGSDDWNRWITACVAVATALFTVVSFSYKELIAPNTAPVNIALAMSIDPKAEKPLQVSQMGLDSTKRSGNYAAMYIRIKAVNASNKTLKILKPFWLVFGRHKPPQTAGETTNSFLASLKIIREFDRLLGDPFLSDVPRLEVERHSYDISGPFRKKTSKGDEALLRGQTRELIAVGELFAQREMRPGETFDSQRVVFVDQDSGYDFLETRVYIPSMIQRNASHTREIQFYAFLERLDPQRPGPWDWKDSKDQMSPRVDRISRVMLINQWCEQPIPERLRTPFRLQDFLNLLQLRIFQQTRNKKGMFLSANFCPSPSSITMSPQRAGVSLTPDQMREAGVQVFTATSEVLLLNSQEKPVDQGKP